MNSCAEGVALLLAGGLVLLYRAWHSGPLIESILAGFLMILGVLYLIFFVQEKTGREGALARWFRKIGGLAERPGNTKEP